MITSTDARNRLTAVLQEMGRTGEPVTITNHGRPVAVPSPARSVPRAFGQFPNLFVPKSFDDPTSGVSHVGRDDPAALTQWLRPTPEPPRPAAGDERPPAATPSGPGAGQ